jgi:hypothetical protein
MVVRFLDADYFHRNSHLSSPMLLGIGPPLIRR